MSERQPDASGASKNTDVSLWKAEDIEVFRTENGEGIGICSWGRCVVKPAKMWVDMAWDRPTPDADRVREAAQELLDAVKAMIRPGNRETERAELGRTKLAVVSLEATLATPAPKPEEGGEAARILERMLMFYAPNGEPGWNGVADDAREFLGLPRTLPKGGL